MPHEKFDLSEFLPYRLAVLAERVSRRLSVEYERLHGLSVAEWRIMAHLSRGDAVSVRDIHLAANLDKPRVSRAVARLVETGFVRKVQGQADGRLVAISLTAKGKKAFGEIVPMAQAFEAGLKGAVSPAELGTFFRVMDRMHAALDADPQTRAR